MPQDSKKHVGNLLSIITGKKLAQIRKIRAIDWFWRGNFRYKYSFVAGGCIMYSATRQVTTLLDTNATNKHNCYYYSKIPYNRI